MERWDGAILYINATSAHLGLKCLHLLGMHALSGCDTTSYPYDKGKISARNTLLSGEFPGLADVLGEVSTPLANLMDGAKPFLALCSVWSAVGNIYGACSIHTLHKSQKHGPTSNIPKFNATPVAGSSAGYVVESGRPSNTT